MHANLCSTTAPTQCSSSDGLSLDGKLWSVFVLSNFFINRVRVDKGNGFFRMAFISLLQLHFHYSYNTILLAPV